MNFIMGETKVAKIKLANFPDTNLLLAKINVSRVYTKYVLRCHSLFVTQNDVATISYPTQGDHIKNRMLEQNHSHFLFTQGASEAASQASRYQYELSLQQSFGEKPKYSAATYV